MSVGRIQGVQEKEYKGVTYKSILEADTAEALDLMGLPIRYEERSFKIFEGFKCPFQKRKVLDIQYIPDFWVGDIILECKGFETPEWKIKRKLVYKYLMEKEPKVMFFQVNKHSWKKDLLEALDPYWSSLGYAIQVSSKPTKKQPAQTVLYESIERAMQDLELTGKTIAPILRALTGKTEYVYGYSWKLKKLTL